MTAAAPQQYGASPAPVATQYNRFPAVTKPMIFSPLPPMPLSLATLPLYRQWNGTAAPSRALAHPFATTMHHRIVTPGNTSPFHGATPAPAMVATMARLHPASAPASPSHLPQQPPSALTTRTPPKTANNPSIHSTSRPRSKPKTKRVTARPRAISLDTSTSPLMALSEAVAIVEAKTVSPHKASPNRRGPLKKRIMMDRRSQHLRRNSCPVVTTTTRGGFPMPCFGKNKAVTICTSRNFQSCKELIWKKSLRKEMQVRKQRRAMQQQQRQPQRSC
mmetsp:Transcript_7471/g.20195  ORF Transcript_7471/g.20195 Transcript_7471/m.20195 type:complete len:276 (-) Transcript_7471:210-1037(-)